MRKPVLSEDDIKNSTDIDECHLTPSCSLEKLVIRKKDGEYEWTNEDPKLGVWYGVSESLFIEMYLEG